MTSSRNIWFDGKEARVLYAERRYDRYGCQVRWGFTCYMDISLEGFCGGCVVQRGRAAPVDQQPPTIEPYFRQSVTSQYANLDTCIPSAYLTAYQLLHDIDLTH